jgi:uncharacterized membrane protein
MYTDIEGELKTWLIYTDIIYGFLFLMGMHAEERLLTHYLSMSPNCLDSISNGIEGHEGFASTRGGRGRRLEKREKIERS